MIRKYSPLVLNIFTQSETKIRKDPFMFSSASNDDKLYFVLTKNLCRCTDYTKSKMRIEFNISLM